jgi:hypothetical protein
MTALWANVPSRSRQLPAAAQVPPGREHERGEGRGEHRGPRGEQGAAQPGPAGQGSAEQGAERDADPGAGLEGAQHTGLQPLRNPLVGNRADDGVE